MSVPVYSDSKRSKRLFQKLANLIPDLQSIPDRATSRIDQGTDLILSVLERTNEYIHISLSHPGYLRAPTGGVLPDVLVELAIFPRDQLGEGLVFKDAIRFEVAYPEPDDLPDVRAHAR